MNEKPPVGVGARLFAVLLIDALLAITIGLGAYNAFGRLHAGISEVTSTLFPAVVTSAKLERQHQRMMRTLEQLASASTNLQQETLRQSLSDQFGGYDLILQEMGADDDSQTRELRELRNDIAGVRERIDAVVSARIQAARAGRESDREIQAITETMGGAEWRASPFPAVRAWLAGADHLLLLAVSAYRAESTHALANLAAGAEQEAKDLGPLARAAARHSGAVAAIQADIERLIAGERSIFAHRRDEMNAAETISGLLARANQVSLVNTGLNTGVFVAKTSLVERRRQDIIQISDLYTKLFFGSIGVVIIGSVLTLIYVQRKVVGRLTDVQEALRARAAGEDMAINDSGNDEITELARALRFYIHETEIRGEELRRSEAGLRALIDSAPLPLLISSLVDDRVRQANRRALELFSLADPTELVGQKGYAVWVDPQARDDFVGRVLAGGAASDYEAQLITADGTSFWALVSGAVFQFEGEDVILISPVSIDATKQAQDELRVAKERAERADSAKTEFLATISHEMRTPLNGILGLGRLLLTGTLRPAERRHANAIMRSGMALLDQVNDILDLRRIEDGKLDLDPAPCALRPLLAEVEGTIATLAHEKGLRLDMTVDTSVPEVVVVDPQRLRQILINLLGNAIKFTDHGRVMLSLSAEADTLLIRVSDTGIGIPRGRQQAIFDKLEQADPSISRRFGGSGLGLAIVKHLLELMGGDIVVDSELAVGSVFSVRLPLIEADEADLPQPAPGGLMPEAERPLSLLLVEDDPINREVAIGLLGEAGHVLSVAETGEQALALFVQGWFDAVLLDIRLPDIEGVEVARRIRAMEDPRRASVPIIAVTANVFAGDRSRYLEAGMDAVVEKPLFPERLARVLTSLTSIGPNVSDPVAPATGPVDMDALADYRRRLGDDRFSTMRRLLLEVAGQRLPLLVDAAATRAEKGEMAHAMAGSASHFGFVQFCGLMRRIEEAVLGKTTEDAEALCLEAQAGFDLARAALDQWCAENGILIASDKA